MPHKSKIIAFQSTGEGFFAGFENCSIPTLIWIMLIFQDTVGNHHFSVLRSIGISTYVEIGVILI